MEPIDWNNISQELERCHGGLMKVWNAFREQMIPRGYETEDAKQEVISQVLQNRDEFRGNSRAEFCSWSKMILRNWVLGKLRRPRAEPLGTNADPADHGQATPSESYQQELRQIVYALTRAVISEADRALIELRFEERLSLADVGERLQKDYPQLWAENRQSWTTEKKLSNACTEARARFGEEAKKIHKQLEAGSPDEPISGEELPVIS